MKTISLLLIILFILMSVIGKKQGIKAFLTIFINMFILALGIILIILKIPVLLTAVVISILMAIINNVLINAYDNVSKTAMISTSITYLIILAITLLFTVTSKIQGFPMEEGDEIATYSLNIGIDFVSITIFMIMVSALGAVIDIAISIASGMEQIYEDNPGITKQKLYQSGMNISRDILGTTTNTLYFAYLGSYITLLIWFDKLNYSFGDIINSKVFASELITILAGGISVICAIPVTCAVALRVMKIKKAQH